METTRTLIAGIGKLGRVIAARLSDAGHQVFGVNRSGLTTIPNISMIAADLTQAATLALPAVDNVVIALAPGSRDPEVYRQTYLGGVRNLLNGLTELPRRLLYVSSSVVYAQDNGEWLDEDSPVSAHNMRAQVQLESEELARGCAASSIILRLSGIYGPGREAMLRKVRSGAPVVVKPPHFTNRITEHDAARLAVHLLDPSIAAGVYLGVDHEPARLHEVCQWLARMMGHEALPEAPPNLTSSTTGRASGKRLSNQRVLGTGFRFQFPTFRDGYAAMLSKSATFNKGNNC